MKRSKLPSDAFTYYVSLGPDRSYTAVSKFFKVDRTTVLKRAKADQWQQKLVELEKKAQQKTEQKIVNSLEEMNERHLKVLRTVLGKALETLRTAPLRTGADAVRAIEMCVKHERVILGEPGDRTAMNFEEVVKREFDRWLVRPEDGDPASAPTPSTLAAPASDSEGFFTTESTLERGATAARVHHDATNIDPVDEEDEEENDESA